MEIFFDEMILLIYSIKRMRKIDNYKRNYKLINLYNNFSKHSNYQTLAKPLRFIISEDNLKIFSRYEVERLNYILERYQIKERIIADIGGNTGFFTIECATQGASEILYFEGNREHAEFVNEAAEVLQLKEIIKTHCQYINFVTDFNVNVDACFLLNVLHHIGDDYGNATCNDVAKKNIISSLSYLSKKVSILFFQIGFNWKGNKDLPLFKNGTKAELINFISEGTKDSWEISSIGIPQKKGSDIEYVDVDIKNIQRDDSLGEFLNRPLFIMKSKNI